jgi:hypothetical protein
MGSPPVRDLLFCANHLFVGAIGGRGPRCAVARGQSGLANGLCCARDPWAKPATDSISVERNFTEVCVFARPLAELAAPPTMRHHAETSAATIADLMLADLRLSHHTLVQQFDGFSLSGIRCGEEAVLLFAAIDLLLSAVRRVVSMQIKSARGGQRAGPFLASQARGRQ